MSFQRTIDVSVDIAAPPDAVWRRVCDHEATPTWVKRGGPRWVRLIEPGAPQPGGKGAIRLVKFAGWPAVTERIVRWDDGSCFEYALVAGMPQLDDHLGRLTVEPVDGGTRFRWHVWFSFRTAHPLSLLAPVFVRGFRGVLQEGAVELKRQCEATG